MSVVVQVVVYLVAAVLGTVAFRARAARRFRMGLGPRAGAAREGALGVLVTTVAMLGIFAVESALGVVRVERVGFDVLVLVVALVIYLVLAALEEVVFRLFALNGLLALTRRPWAAVAGSTVLFALVHAFNTGATPLSLLSATLGGVMYGLAFVLSGRVWMPLGMHLAWNFVQGTVLGFPVSGTAAAGVAVLHQAPVTAPVWLAGGAYGPEGGVVGIGFRLLVIAAVVLLARRRSTAPPVGEPVT